MVLRLLSAKLISLRNAPRANDSGRFKVALFGVFGIVIWLAIFFGARWFLGECLAVEPIGELLVEKMLDLTLLVIFSVLVFSNVITTFSTFYLADDLELLMASPIPPNSLYTARLIETAVLSAWMPLVFAMPVFVAVGLLYDTPALFYAAVVAVLVVLSVIAAALAVPVALLLTNVLPVQRTRDVLIFMGLLCFAVLFVVARAINPEELFNPDHFAGTMELFASLETSNSPWSPSHWALAVLTPWLRDDPAMDALHAAALISSSAALYYVGAWIFRRWHLSGYSKSQQGRHGGGGLERAVRRGRPRASEAEGIALGSLATAKGALSPLREHLRKDIRVFIRDTAQWSQLLLLIALVAIYLLNFRHFRTLGDSGVIGPVGLFVMNIGLCGFVVAAVGMRFLFPAVSLEGRSFWLIRTAPISMGDFLWAKTAAGLLPLLVMSELLVLTSNLMIGVGVGLTVGAAVAVLSMNLGVAGLGVGIGAIYPRFNLDNAAKIATGFGGMLYMISALTLVVAVTAATVAPAWYLAVADINPEAVIGSRQIALGVASILVVMVLPSLVGFAALRLGARSLARR